MCYSLKKEGSLGGGAKVALQQIIPSLLSCVRLADFGGAGRTQLFLFETSRCMWHSIRKNYCSLGVGTPTNQRLVSTVRFSE